MNKISSNDAATLLKQAGASLRAVAQERDNLREKVAQFQRDQTVVKIARDMEDKGLSSDLTFEQKVAAVRRSHDLRVTEEAVKMAAPQSQIFGNPAELSGGSNGSAFEHYIATGEDPVE